MLRAKLVRATQDKCTNTRYEESMASRLIDIVLCLQYLELRYQRRVRSIASVLNVIVMVSEDFISYNMQCTNVILNT